MITSVSPKINVGQNSFKANPTNSVVKILKEAEDKATDLIGHGIGRLAKSKPGKNTAESMTKMFKKPYARIMDLTSAIYTLSIINKTAKSEKIKKEQKPMLMINAALVTIVSSSLAALIDKLTDPVLDKMVKEYESFKKPDKWLDNRNFKTAVNKMKSLSIFSLTVRFLVPVIMVPITGSIVNKIKTNKEDKEKQDSFNSIAEANKKTKPN